MATLHRPNPRGPIRLVAALASVAILAGACGSTADPSAGTSSAPAVPPGQAAPSAAAETPQAPTDTQAPGTTPAATPTPTLAPVPTAAPSAAAAPTPTATAAPTPQPTATPAPSPSAAPATVVDDWVWAYEKRPLTLKGTAGVTTWSKVLFAAKSVDLRWSATPASSAGCTFRYRVASSSLARAVAGSQEVKGSRTASGSRGMAISYGDGAVTVTTDCATYTLKVVSTGHPGLTIKQADDPYKATGSTASELNDALADAYGAWRINSRTRYYAGGTIRVASFTATINVDYTLPAWKAPEGTDQALIDSWNTALGNMRTHTEGEAAIGIQAAGRYLAASTRKSFGSVAAMNRYREKLSDRWVDWASDKTESYNEATQYGYTQGAFIE